MDSIFYKHSVVSSFLYLPWCNAKAAYQIDEGAFGTQTRASVRKIELGTVLTFRRTFTSHIPIHKATRISIINTFSKLLLGRKYLYTVVLQIRLYKASVIEDSC